jgi:CHAT domain-containing protein
MFGLTAAFFAAGARRVFGTLWPVDSSAAVPITTALHRHLAAGAAPEFAWQEAVRGYLKTAGPLKRKIYYWAPFFLSAMGRPRYGAPIRKEMMPHG